MQRGMNAQLEAKDVLYKNNVFLHLPPLILALLVIFYAQVKNPVINHIYKAKLALKYTFIAKDHILLIQFSNCCGVYFVDSVYYGYLQQ